MKCVTLKNKLNRSLEKEGLVHYAKQVIIIDL